MRATVPVIKAVLEISLGCWLFLACVPEKAAPTVPTPEPPAAPEVDSLVVQWVQSNLREVGPPIPQSGLADLQELGSALSGKRILFIGQSVDGSSEITLLKQRLLELTLQELNFRLLVLETPYAETGQLDDWLQGGPGDPLALVDSLGLWHLRTTEFIGLLEWLRNYNLTLPEADRRHVFGVNPAYPAASPQHLRQFLQPLDSGLAGWADARIACFRPFLRDPAAYRAGSSGLQDSCMAGLQQLQDSLQIRRDTLAALSSGPQTDLALQHVQILLQAERLFRLNLAGSGVRTRQQLMADNINWLEQYFARKTVVWTDNFGAAYFPRQVKTMPAFVQEQRSQPDVSVIGISFLQGSFYQEAGSGAQLQTAVDTPFGSYENYISSVEKPVGLLLLDPVSSGSVRTDWLFNGLSLREQNGFYVAALANEFNFFFYIETISPAGWLTR